jgi:hypothetical protein
MSRPSAVPWRCVSSIGVAILALAWTPAASSQAAEPNGDSFFLSSRAMPNRAHVPLAVVHGGQVADAVQRPARWPAQRPRGCGTRDRWAVVGSRWRALDSWGQVLGDAAVVKREIYDVTHCAELTLSKVPGAGATTLYVSADSAWHAAPPPAFTPPASAAAALAGLAAARIDDRAVRGAPLHPECAAIRERTRFFVAAGGRRYGVATSNVGYLVARLDGDSWTVVASELTAPHKPDDYRCYRPVAVFDMNGDGTPEVVLRQSAGEAWGDLVVGRAPVSDGAGESWHVAALSPGSAVI